MAILHAPRSSRFEVHRTFSKLGASCTHLEAPVRRLFERVISTGWSPLQRSVGFDVSLRKLQTNKSYTSTSHL